MDEILVFHPLYKQWTKGAKLGQAGLMAFLHASTWPECIQNSSKCPGYASDGTQNGMVPTATQEEWQNIGFSDRLMHKYWHFIQTPYGAEGQTTGEIQRPNIETQLQILVNALNSNADDSLKAYDLSWVENLIADLHQPLNCITRFGSQHPSGDRNGRDVKLRETPPNDNLHDYWDNLLGTEEGIEAAIKGGKVLANVQKQTGWVDEIDIDRWISESVEVVKNSVYTLTVIAQDDSGKYLELDAAYRKAAIQVAVNQAVLAGNRLASLLNNRLK